MGFAFVIPDRRIIVIEANNVADKLNRCVVLETPDRKREFEQARDDFLAKWDQNWFEWCDRDKMRQR